jgi:hypothetical protein
MKVGDYNIFQGFAKALQNMQENLGIPGKVRLRAE